MKKLLLCCAALAAFMYSAHAGERRAITPEQLPAAAQEFLKTHFGELTPAIVAEEGALWGKTYEVLFTDRTEVEFDDKGQWTEVHSRMGALPLGIVPEALAGFVGQNYPQATIRGIERDRQGWEVLLDNGLELEFDRKMQLVNIDD